MKKIKQAFNLIFLKVSIFFLRLANKCNNSTLYSFPSTPFTQPLSEPLPTLSQPVQPTENIKKVMTWLAWQHAITQRTQKNGSRTLAIFRKNSEHSVN